MKKLFMVVMAIVLVFGVTATASADANLSWDAGKGTATVDGEKDDVYAGAQKMDLSVASDIGANGADDTSASAWVVYDNEAIYFFVEVSDSVLDDTNANVWEKDSVELRLENKDQLAQAYAVSETYDGTIVSEAKVLKTDKGYNVEFKAPYATAEGSSVMFSLQVNAASNGKRNNTLHTSDDLKDAWQNNDVFETLVFSSSTASVDAVEDSPKTGDASTGYIYMIAAVACVASCVLFYSRRKTNKIKL